MSTPLYHLDWLTLSGRGYTDSAGVQWILMEETGFWDSPEPRKDIVERVNAHGSYMGPSYYQHRIVTLTGRAYAQDARQIRTAWSRISGMGSSTPTQSLALSCDSEIGTLTCQVRRDDAVITKPVPLLNVNAFEFSMQLIAPDPRKYSADWRTMRAGLPEATTGDGLDFTTSSGGMTPFKGLDFVNPGGLMFGASNATGLLQLTNGGTAPTVPIYTLYGPLTTPVLTATVGATSYSLKFNGTLSAGQRVVIDPSVPSVLLDGTASRRHLLNPAQFSGFAIPAAAADGTAGVLNVGLTHSGATTTGGYATARFREAWF